LARENLSGSVQLIEDLDLDERGWEHGTGLESLARAIRGEKNF